MSTSEATTKQDFVNFLTDDRSTIQYDNKTFTKDTKGKIIRIKIDDDLIYEVHTEKKMLIVTNAVYCTFNRDEYWGIANLAGLEEVIADRNTLVRI